MGLLPISHRLGFKVLGPIMVFLLLFGGAALVSVYFAISQYVTRQAATDLHWRAQSVFQIIDSHLDELGRTGRAIDETAVRSRKVVALTAVDDFARINEIRVVVKDALERAPTVLGVDLAARSQQAAPLPRLLGDWISGTPPSEQAFRFEPWNWDVAVMQDDRAYHALLSQLLWWATLFGLALIGGLAVLMARLASITGKPFRTIISDLQAQRPPHYTGIAEFEYLARSIASMMEALVRARNELESRVEQRTEELRRSEERFRHLAESASDWFWETDESLRLTYISGSFAEATGMPVEDVIGKRRWELIDPAELALQREKWDRHRTELEAQRPFRGFEYTVRSPAGEAVHLRITGQPFYGADGRFAGYRGTGSDITELVTAQAELLRSEKLAALGGLVAGVAHEINTPVGIGITAASHLEDQARQFEQVFAAGQVRRSDIEQLLRAVQDNCASLLSNLRRAANLVRSFKQVAVDQSSESRRRFDLNQYLREVLQSLQPQLRRSPVVVEVDCPEGIELNSFPGAYSQIVTNLVLNSLIHGFAPQQPGRIGIDVRVDADCLHLRYADDGIGMPEEHAAKVFQPFFTTRRGQGGSGLGLHLVYNLVTQTLRGRIECVTAPGRGTVFLLRIPL